jgi:hypothetical protein
MKLQENNDLKKKNKNKNKKSRQIICPSRQELDISAFN